MAYSTREKLEDLRDELAEIISDSRLEGETGTRSRVRRALEGLNGELTDLIELEEDLDARIDFRNSIPTAQIAVGYFWGAFRELDTSTEDAFRGNLYMALSYLEVGITNIVSAKLDGTPGNVVIAG